MHLAPAVRLAWTRPEPPPAGEEFRVASVNVYADNRRTDALERWLSSEAPEVVAILEVTEYWARHLESTSFLAGYEHALVEPRPGAFGIALFSRLPFVSARSIEVGSPGVPYIEAIVDHDGCQVKVLVVHTFPPVTPPMTSARDHVLDEVLTRLDPTFPTVVMGDLNVTLYSPAFRRFVRDGDLVDSRRGFGRMATWMPVLGPAGLDLDHVLTSAGLATRSRRVGPAFGSDHLPVAADLVRESSYCVPVPEREGSGSP